MFKKIFFSVSIYLIIFIQIDSIQADTIDSKKYKELRSAFKNRTISKAPIDYEIESLSYICKRYYLSKPKISDNVETVPNREVSFTFDKCNGFYKTSMNLKTNLYGIDVAINRIMNSSTGSRLILTDQFGGFSEEQPFGTTFTEIIRKVGNSLIIEESIGKESRFYNKFKGYPSEISNKKAISYSICEIDKH